MSYYTPLPGYDYPRNALINFEPISQGIDAVAKGLEARRKRLAFDNLLNGTPVNESYESPGGWQNTVQGTRPNSLLAGVNPTSIALARAAGYEQGLPMLARSLEHEQDRQFRQRELAMREAGEQRTAELFPYQKHSAYVDSRLKQREIDTPKESLQKVKDDERLFLVNPNTGQKQEIVGTNNDTGYKSLKDRVDIEHKLRAEYTGQAKTFVDARDAYNRIEVGARNPSAAGDVAMIFNYMRLLDPASTVREGEFATAQNAAGVDVRIANIYNKLLSGERLHPKQREDFLNQARHQFSTYASQHEQLKNQYIDIAKAAKLDPSRVGINLDTTGTHIVKNPDEVRLGVDSKDPTNWKYFDSASGEWRPIPGARGKPWQEAEKLARGLISSGSRPVAPGQVPDTRNVGNGDPPSETAVRYLRQRANDPSVVRQFDERYGSGAAARILQGR